MNRIKEQNYIRILSRCKKVLAALFGLCLALALWAGLPALRENSVSTASAAGESYTLQSYVFGANGTTDEMGEPHVPLALERTLVAAEGEQTPAQIVASGGSFSAVFSKRGSTGSVPLVNGLPWYAGEYIATVTVTYRDASTRTISGLSFEVLPRKVMVEWGSMNAVYSGVGQMPTAVLNNPAEDADKNMPVPMLNAVLVGTHEGLDGGKPVNASDYVCGVELSFPEGVSSAERALLSASYQTAGITGEYHINAASVEATFDDTSYSTNAKGKEIKTDVYTGNPFEIRALAHTLTGSTLTLRITYYSSIVQDGMIQPGSLMQQAPVAAGTYFALATSPDTNYAILGRIKRFTIKPAPLTLKFKDKTVAYGTSLSDAGAVGLEFSAYDVDCFDAVSLMSQLDMSRITYDTDYTVTTAAGSECTVALGGVTSMNFVIDFLSGKLTVVSRPIELTVLGIDDGNPYAAAAYRGTDMQSALEEAFSQHKSAFLSAAEGAFGGVGQEEGLRAIRITLKLPLNSVRAGSYAISGQSLDNNYTVTFKGNAQFRVNKAPLTVALGQTDNQGAFSSKFTVTYGEDIGAVSCVYTGFQNGETFDRLQTLGEASATWNYTVYCGDKAYEPYHGLAGEEYEVALTEDSKFVFANYEVSVRVPAEVTVTSRIISASIPSREYTEDVVHGVVEYHDGMFGAPLEASVTFRNSEDVLDGELIGYDLTYLTTDGGAPRTAGTFSVRISLKLNTEGGYNYVFEDGSPSCVQKYEITKKKIVKSPENFGWRYSSMVYEESGERQTNTISAFVRDIMTVIGAYRIYTNQEVTTEMITEGVGDGHYQIGADGKGITLPVYGIGQYFVDVRFTDAASANYEWTVFNDAYRVSTFVVSTKTVELSVSVQGWTYGEPPSSPVGKVSTDRTSLIQYTYARMNTVPEHFIERLEKENGFAVTRTELYSLGLRFNATPQDVGVYVVRAYYPFDDTVGAGNVTAYYLFRINRKLVSAPQLLTVTEGEGRNNVYTGEKLIMHLTGYFPEYMRINAKDIHVDNEKTGAVLEITDANPEGYEIAFSFLTDNYAWDESSLTEEQIATLASTGKVVLKWFVQPARDNSITFDGKMEFKYGEAYDLLAKAKYTSNLVYMYRAVDGDYDSMKPSDAGTYYVRVSCDATKNFNGAVLEKKFVIKKATLKVTPSGTMTYGEDFALACQDFTYKFSGFIRGDADWMIQTKQAEIDYIIKNGETLNAGKYDLTLNANENGVFGFYADNYIIISEVGELNVERKSIMLHIGNLSSAYTVTPVLTLEKLLDADELKEALAAGDTADDLKIEFTTDATKTSVVGIYAIYAKNYLNENYSITFVDGLYTVEKLEIGVEMTAENGVYGEKTAKILISDEISTAVEGADAAYVTSVLRNKLTLEYTGKTNAGETYSSTEVPTEAGSYTATLAGVGNNCTIASKPSIAFTVEKKTIDEELISAPAQTYTGKRLVPEIQDDTYGAHIYEFTLGNYVNADTYSVALRLVDSANMRWRSTEASVYNLAFVIEKAENAGIVKIENWRYGEYDEELNAPSVILQFPNENVRFTYSASRTEGFSETVPASGDVGLYYVRAEAPESENCKAYISDPVMFAITKRPVSAITLGVITSGEEANDVYTGLPLSIEVQGYDTRVMSNTSYSDGVKVHTVLNSFTAIAVGAGEYRLRFTLDYTNNYEWASDVETVSGDPASVELVWKVAKKKVAKPTASKQIFVLNGKVLTYIPEGFDETCMSIADNRTGFGGNFVVTVTLTDPTNFTWEDGTDAPVLFNWHVGGINVVFIVVISVVAAILVVGIVIAIVQITIHRKKKKQNGAGEAIAPAPYTEPPAPTEKKPAARWDAFDREERK